MKISTRGIWSKVSRQGWFATLLVCCTWLLAAATPSQAASLPDEMSRRAAICVEPDRQSCQEDRANRVVLYLPDLKPLPPHELELVVQGQRRSIRFSNSVANIGKGTLEVTGEYDALSDRAIVTQNLYRSDDSRSLRDIGEFHFHHSHNHWHWDNFSTYEIWSVDLNGDLTDLVVTSGKVSYCMLDISRVEAVQDANGTEPAEPQHRAQYTQCGWRKQGITPGWMDTYARHIPGQVMDISDLPDGLYSLRTTANPAGILEEVWMGNNYAQTYFYLQGNALHIFTSLPNELSRLPLN